VAEPGLELTVKLPPNMGFFTLVWQTRTDWVPNFTSQDAHVPALH
jgi:hypothetical protein